VPPRISAAGVHGTDRRIDRKVAAGARNIAAPGWNAMSDAIRSGRGRRRSHGPAAALRGSRASPGASAATGVQVCIEQPVGPIRVVQVHRRRRARVDLENGRTIVVHRKSTLCRRRKWSRRWCATVKSGRSSVTIVLTPPIAWRVWCQIIARVLEWNAQGARAGIPLMRWWTAATARGPACFGYIDCDGAK